jgi:hypothetical protein
VLGPAHLVVESGNREAALVVFAQAGVENFEFGIDEHPGLVARLGDVQHQDAPLHIDLAGGESHAGSGVHGLQQVVDQPPDAVVDLGDRQRLLPQSGIGKFQNSQNRHKVVTAF